MIRSSKSSKDITDNNNEAPHKITLRKKPLFVYDQVYRNSFFMNLIKERMKLHQTKGHYRQNMFGEEIVRNGVLYKCLSPRGKKYMRYLYIFNLVKQDAKRYLQNHGNVKAGKWSSSVHYNEDQSLVHKRMIGTDIDEAYWDIAFKMGVISFKTYQHRDKIKHKELLLASLASLGADKMWRNVNGVVGNDVTIVRGDDQLKEVFKKIRYTCFRYMQQLARMLGPSFASYKTDCIYYVDTKSNVKLVRDFLQSKGLQFKQLHNPKEMREDEF